MIYVGIDVAKLNHFASVISRDGEELIKPFKFTNDAEGFQLLSSHLDSLPDKLVRVIYMILTDKVELNLA